MTSIARAALSRISQVDLDADVETLKTVVLFCAVGLTVTLMCASYGLDLSLGFF